MENGVKTFISGFSNRIWYPSSLNKLSTKLYQTITVDYKLSRAKKRMTQIAQIQLVQLGSWY